jgi:lysophospholipase L1-like esterase
MAGRTMLAVLAAGVAVPMPAAAADHWAGAWGYAASASPDAKARPAGTYRYRVTPTQTGDALTLSFSNAEGAQPIAIDHVTVARAAAAGGTAFDPATARAVTLSHAAGAALPAGRIAVSDPVPFPVKTGSDLIVSVSFSTPTNPLGSDTGIPADFVPGRDATRDARPAGAEPAPTRPYLSLVSVRRATPGCTIVAYGDSITDGYHSQSPTTRGWPGRLAERLAQLPETRRCGVVNMGLSANRVLRSGQATAALDRFWRDVASVPGATTVILLEGINDIGNSGRDAPPLTPDDIVAGYRQMIARAHAQGLRIVGGTLTPALGAGYMSPDKDKLREAANRFIRTSGEFDGVIDFEKAVRDPAHPEHIRPDYDPGDHLHPNDAGYRAMGDAVDLGLVTKR